MTLHRLKVVLVQTVLLVVCKYSSTKAKVLGETVESATISPHLYIYLYTYKPSITHHSSSSLEIKQYWCHAKLFRLSTGRGAKREQEQAQQAYVLSSSTSGNTFLVHCSR